MAKKKESALNKVIVFSVLLFVFILVFGTLAFVFSMRQFIKKNKFTELQRTIVTEKIWLESVIKPELDKVIKLAKSPVVKDYIISPSDPALETTAMAAITAYRDSFSDYNIFWSSTVDHIFHFDEIEPYYLDAAKPENYWYNMTLYDTEEYNFNINYNPDLDQIRLWINAPIFDDYGIPVGMVGTGIALPKFIKAAYSNIDESSIELFFYDADGKILCARDIDLVKNGVNISDMLQDTEKEILGWGGGITLTPEPGAIAIVDIPSGMVATGEFPAMGWHFIAFARYGAADYSRPLTALFLAVLALILLILVAVDFFIARILKSLQRIQDAFELAVKEKELGLIADNEMLDRMNRMKNALCQSMGHDFKTPLTIISTSILNAMDMLSFEIDKSEMQIALESAQQEIMRMSHMIDGAIKQSTLYDNNMGMKPIRLETLLREEASAYRKLIERDGNTLLVKVPADLPPIYGNADIVLLALSNLLSNAGRHTRNGTITISAAAKGDVVSITVTDTGTGISPDLLPYVFERGVSVGGTGLGLSICKTAVEVHDGTITIDSEKGKGTAVTFTLPMHKEGDGGDKHGR